MEIKEIEMGKMRYCKRCKYSKGVYQFYFVSSIFQKYICCHETNIIVKNNYAGLYKTREYKKKAEKLNCNGKCENYKKKWYLRR